MTAKFDFSEFQRGLATASERARAAARQALLEVANQTIGDSHQLCPVDTGALQSSATVGDLKESANSMSVEIGHNVNYAAAVHERLDVHHGHGQAKFLETAMRENAPKLTPHLAKKLKAAL